MTALPRHLEIMEHVSNIDALVGQVKLAAAKFTPLLRQSGIALHDDDGRPPMLDEVEDHLFQLVASAYYGLLDVYKEAPAGSVDLALECSDSDDRLFDVFLQTIPGQIAGLELTISLRA